MKTRTLRALFLYNYRYWLGYGSVVVFILYFLGWRLGTLPGGISQAELISAARHTHLMDIVNLPLYPLHSLLQWLSFQFLEITALTLRLPSIIIALATAFCLYQLLKRWFGKPTALLSTAIFISADWFLFIARLGSGAIEFSFWLCLALLCFTKLLERKTWWTPPLALSLVGLLFAPLGIYAVVTLLIGLFSCRIFRERFNDAANPEKVLAYVILLAGVGAMVAASIHNFEFLKNLLEIQTLPSATGYLKNVFINSSAVAVVTPDANPLISVSGFFFVRFFELMLVLFGVIMLWRTRVNRLNLLVIALSAVLALASGLSAGARGGTVLLVLAAIYMTAGIRYLVHRWQKTFPKNPYARVTAFASLAVLFVCVVSLHFSMYFSLWPSQSSTRGTFTKDFALAKTELDRSTYQGKTCLVETNDAAMQDLLLASKTTCQPIFPSSSLASKLPAVLIVGPKTNLIGVSASDSIKPLTSDTKNDSLRWLVVSNPTAN